MKSSQRPITVSSPELPYYPALDGVRGVGILLILLSHNFSFLDFSRHVWFDPMDIFFVLSGFLITDIILSTIQKPRFLKNFYTRRALRILPLYYVSLIIFLFILPLFIHFPGAEFYRENFWWFLAYIQNWLIILFSTSETNSLDHFWSLAVEEQFYLFWPLIILLLKKPLRIFNFLIFLLLAVLAARLWVWELQLPEISYFKLYNFTRIDGLCIGCSIAILRRSNPKLVKHFLTIALAFALLLNLLFFLFQNFFHHDLPYLAFAGFLTISVITGFLIHYLAKEKHSVLTSLFSLPVLRFLGKISYSVYIVHWPIHLLLRPHLESIFANSSFLVENIFISIVTSIIAINIGWLSFRFFESWFLKQKRRFV